jgi:hypothetical protein
MVNVRNDGEITDVVHQVPKYEAQKTARLAIRKHEKKGASADDAPVTNNLWQLRWLGLHCRQKARNTHPDNTGAAALQLHNAHFINILSTTSCEDLVGVLCMKNGSSCGLSHRDFSTALFTT